MLSLRNFLSSCKRVMQLIKKPDKDELSLSVKINLIGIGILGVIGFIIKFISTILQATSIG